MTRSHASQAALMTDGQTETQESIMSEDNKCCRKFYAACMYCPCTEKWEIKGVYLCRKDAAAHCEDRTRVAVRENRPLEHWHVSCYVANTMDVVWGCRCVEQPDDAGAPDCV